MKVNGNKTSDQEEALSYFQVEIVIKVSTRMEKQMEKGSILGIQVKCMMESGGMV